MANTNPLNYNQFVTALATLAVVNVHMVAGVVVGNNDSAFDILIPQALSYAENRIQRDLDLLESQIAINYTTTANNNILSIPTDDFVTIQTMVVNGTPLIPVSKEFMQNVYPSNASNGPPQYFAMYGGDTVTGGNTTDNIILGPWPDNNYPVTITGTQRLPSLYKFANAIDAGTKTTWISTYLPDMLLQASMVLVSQYQRQFGATSGNSPEMPGSYEAQYQALLKGAITESFRDKFQASSWTSNSPAIIATPGR